MPCSIEMCLMWESWAMLSRRWSTFIPFEESSPPSTLSWGKRASSGLRWERRGFASYEIQVPFVNGNALFQHKARILIPCNLFIRPLLAATVLHRMMFFRDTKTLIQDKKYLLKVRTERMSENQQAVTTLVTRMKMRRRSCWVKPLRSQWKMKTRMMRTNFWGRQLLCRWKIENDQISDCWSLLMADEISNCFGNTTSILLNCPTSKWFQISLCTVH